MTARMPSAARIAALALSLLAAPPALAHHGSAGVGMAGPEGPGAAIETTSPIPLPRGSIFFLLKSEYVPFRQFDFAQPENKVYSLFDTLALGYGAAPWLSAYLFLPYNVKSQDGVGTNVGFGDPGLFVQFAFKYDDGFRLVPEKESLDELMDWHFSVFGFATVPMGPTISATDALEWYAPDMQTGFGSPSFQSASPPPSSSPPTSPGWPTRATSTSSPTPTPSRDTSSGPSRGSTPRWPGAPSPRPASASTWPGS